MEAKKRNDAQDDASFYRGFSASATLAFVQGLCVLVGSLLSDTTGEGTRIFFAVWTVIAACAAWHCSRMAKEKTIKAVESTSMCDWAYDQIVKGATSEDGSPLGRAAHGHH